MWQMRPLLLMLLLLLELEKWLLLGLRRRLLSLLVWWRLSGRLEGQCPELRRSPASWGGSKAAGGPIEPRVRHRLLRAHRIAGLPLGLLRLGWIIIVTRCEARDAKAPFMLFRLGLRARSLRTRHHTH